MTLVLLVAGMVLTTTAVPLMAAAFKQAGRPAESRLWLAAAFTVLAAGGLYAAAGLPALGLITGLTALPLAALWHRYGQATNSRQEDKL